VSDCQFSQRPMVQGGGGAPPDLALRAPAFFLDRDNTLVRDSGYVHQPRYLELLPGVEPALLRMYRAGWRTLVVSNQAGVARGHFALADAYAFNEALAFEVERIGAAIDEIRFCPHHIDGRIQGLRKECNSRKPGPGMLLEMARDWNIDMGRSVMIGDQATDVQAGVAAGVRGILVQPGELDRIVCRVLSEDLQRKSYLKEVNRGIH